MRTRRGFTFVEAIMAVAVLALLATLAVPSFQNLIARMKVRTTVEIISQLIISAKSEALRRNVNIYVESIGGNMCIGTTSGGCDLRQEPLVTGVSVSTTKLMVSPFYGVPSPAPATYTVTYSGFSQSVTINRLGVLTVGALS